jgi:hypothetical protein
MAKNKCLRAATTFVVMLNVHIGFGQTNPVLNPGFENWSGGAPVNWNYSGISYISQENNERFEGSSSARFQIPTTSTTVDLYQDISITGGGVYSFSCRVLDNMDHGEVGLIINWRNDGGSLGYDNSGHSADQSGWQEISLQNQHAPANATIARIRIRGYQQNGTGGGFVYSDDAVFSGDLPLSVHLNSLEAVPVEDGVEIRWMTQSELETCGFFLSRSESAEGPFESITTALIPSRGENSSGTEYLFVDRFVSPNIRYWYKLEEQELGGRVSCLGIVQARISGKNRTATTHRLLGNYPNPFNPNTTLAYQVASENERSRIRIDVFNLFGQKVKTLVDDLRQPGDYSVEWDGKGEYGMEVPSGIYLCRLESGDDGMVLTHRMIKVR